MTQITEMPPFVHKVNQTIQNHRTNEPEFIELSDTHTKSYMHESVKVTRMGFGTRMNKTNKEDKHIETPCGIKMTEFRRTQNIARNEKFNIVDLSKRK